MKNTDFLIDRLVSDAVPVRPQSTRRGRLVLLGIGAATMAAVLMMFGPRPDLVAGRPAPFFVLVTGLLLILAMAAGAGASRMANPQVGAANSGANWALAAVLLLPLIAAIDVLVGTGQTAGLDAEPGLYCLMVGLGASTASLLFLGFWLRRGAPVSPGPASWLAGIAAGSIGALAVTLECARDSIAHIGLWHVAVVLSVGAISRLILPRLLKW